LEQVVDEHENEFVSVSGAAHWDRVHADRRDTDTSWYEPLPRQSLAMLDQLGVGPDQSAIDVGAGTSRLVDALLARGHADVTALDLSAAALQRSMQRLGRRATEVSWVVADVVTWQPTRRFDVWHDRAVFHFFTDPAQQAGYARALRSAVPVGAAVVVAAFADDGPIHCSGLPVARYNPNSLAAALGVHLDVIAAHRVEHQTPWETVQPFTWIAGRRA
jgi:SAM-dependent methyltransferase